MPQTFLAKGWRSVKTTESNVVVWLDCRRSVLGLRSGNVGGSGDPVAIDGVGSFGFDGVGGDGVFVSGGGCGWGSFVGGVCGPSSFNHFPLYKILAHSYLIM